MTKQRFDDTPSFSSIKSTFYSFRIQNLFLFDENQVCQPCYDREVEKNKAKVEQMREIRSDQRSSRSQVSRQDDLDRNRELDSMHADDFAMGRHIGSVASRQSSSNSLSRGQKDRSSRGMIRVDEGPHSEFPDETRSDVSSLDGASVVDLQADGIRHGGVRTEVVRVEQG